MAIHGLNTSYGQSIRPELVASPVEECFNQAARKLDNESVYEAGMLHVFVLGRWSIGNNTTCLVLVLYMLHYVYPITAPKYDVEKK